MITQNAEEGVLEILNVGHGDVELRFKKENSIDLERARQTITDMMRRGYALFVRDGENLIRVRAFDPSHDEYIVGDDIPSKQINESFPAKRARASKMVPITKTKAVAVGRSAGG